MYVIHVDWSPSSNLCTRHTSRQWNGLYNLQKAFLTKTLSGQGTNICFWNYSLLGKRISGEKQFLVCNINQNMNTQKLKISFSPSCNRCQENVLTTLVTRRLKIFEPCEINTTYSMYILPLDMGGISYIKYVNGRRTGLVTFCVETAFYNGLLKER
jgi:hypothetical protein